MNGKNRGRRAPTPAGTAGYSERAVRAMRDMRADGQPIKAIARAWGVPKATAARLTRGVESSIRKAPVPEYARRTGSAHADA